MENKPISQAVIGRLPRYYRYLEELKNADVERISSQELSRLMHVTASQIRQDFNNFGGFGQQGYGYNVAYLHNEIGNLLGINLRHDMILIGAGKLGQAVIGYINGKELPYSFKAAFDINPSLHGISVNGVTIYPMEEMGDYIRDNHISIAAMTAPRTEAVKIAEKLVEYKIKAIWNFAHIDLRVPESIKVENVHLLDSLMKISYNLASTEH